MASVQTSGQLKVGESYTRARLAHEFGVKDATLNTGVFRPKGHDSVWLFVTESKPKNRTQYEDRLVGDVLRWQGQVSGRTDLLIVKHAAEDLELLLFYRVRADQPFRYEGRFEYVKHEASKPTTFTLRRVAPS